MSNTEDVEREDPLNAVRGHIAKMRNDSEFFMGEHVRNAPGFSIEKEENALSADEREIRWHMRVIEAMEILVRENEDLRRRISVLEEDGRNYATARSIMTDEIEQLNTNLDMQITAFVDYRDKVEQELDNLRTSGSVGKNITQIRVKPPIFADGEHDRPMHFLSELQNYVEVTKITDEQLIPILQQCLIKKASNWFYTVDHMITCFEDFEYLFKERYWNEPIKSALRTKFEVGKYDANSKKSRVEYAESLLSTTKELNLQLEDSDIMIKISRHFEDEISRTVRLQGIKSTGQLYDLLQDYDNRDAAKRGAVKKPFTPQIGRSFGQNNQTGGKTFYPRFGEQQNTQQSSSSAPEQGQQQKKDDQYARKPRFGNQNKTDPPNRFGNQPSDPSKTSKFRGGDGRYEKKTNYGVNYLEQMVEQIVKKHQQSKDGKPADKKENE